MNRLIALFGLLLVLILESGCDQVRQDARRAKREIQSTKEKVKKDLKAIQLHGEVDLEVMTQLTAVNDAYRKYLSTKSAAPSSWVELLSVAEQASSVQEAQRQNAFVRFGITSEQLAADPAKSESLIAIKSLNDDSIWAVTLGGDVVPITADEYRELTSEK